MVRSGLDRRVVLRGAGAFGLLSALAAFDAPQSWAGAEGGEPGVAFTPDMVRTRAEELASAEFVRPAVEVPAPFDALTAAQYKDIRFRAEETVWRGERIEQELQLLPLGWIYNTPVEVFIVEGGAAKPLSASARNFAFGPSIEQAPEEAPFGLSGFRLLSPINRADQSEEYVVFQGASYFRAVGRGQMMGLSARGLAINTAQPTGEEFPIFRAFWIEKPKGGAQPVVVHALLDSPSVSGAYRFRIEPGASTTIDITATLYPRKAIAHIGLAPLTSMYLTGTASHRVEASLWPAAHNSEGLAIWNGKGERLWRPLANPKMLQTSAFIDANPKGFGLCQRDRSFAAFDDLSARYERRPTVWVEPHGAWGPGYIELIEIPTEDLINDNIVAYWKPAKPLEPGTGHAIAYRLTWGTDIPVAWAAARVRKTRVGKTRRDKEEYQVFVVDFDGEALKELRDLPLPELAASAGTVSNLSVARNGEIDGVRVTFELATAGVETVELRLGLKMGDQLISETWLFRWTQT